MRHHHLQGLHLSLTAPCRLAALIAVLAGVLGGCSVDTYAPYDFKRVPGYTPPGGVSSPARLTKLPLESDHLP